MRVGEERRSSTESPDASEGNGGFEFEREFVHEMQKDEEQGHEHEEQKDEE